MKKGVIGIILITAVIFGLAEWMKYTTFDKAVSEHLDEETEVRNISIEMNRFPDNPDNSGLPETEAHATIEDQVIIENILEDLSQLELKRQESSYKLGDYSVSILKTDETGEDSYETTSFRLELAQDFIFIYGKYYEIVNDADPLEIIEVLVESDEVEWIFYD